jgi:uncharacterized protein YfaT (DUF1175 family)
MPSGPTAAQTGTPLEERAGAVGGLYRDERGRAPGNTRAAEGVRDAASADGGDHDAEGASVVEPASKRTNADWNPRRAGQARMQPIRIPERARAPRPGRRAASGRGRLRWALLLPVMGFTVWVAAGILRHGLNGSWRSEESFYRIETPQASGATAGHVGTSAAKNVAAGDEAIGSSAREPAWKNPATWADSFGDGTPDFLRLTGAADREAFRQWFVMIADSETMRPAGKVPPEITDCASLLRYAYREALMKHDAGWLKDTGMGVRALPGEIGAWHYPDTPLGVGLFRLTPGPFEHGDEGTGAFAQSADAKTLVERNAYLVSRNVWQAEPGDLLFYRQLGQSPWQSMIVTRVGSDAAVVYYAGEEQSPHGQGPVPGDPDQSPQVQGPVPKDPDHSAAGGLRRMELTELLGDPHGEWQPLASNPNFMGVYRWNILREALR